MGEEGRTAFALLGEVTSPHGVRGAVKAASWTDFPSRVDSIREAWLLSQAWGIQKRGLDEATFGNGFFFLKFSGCDSLEKARRLVGCRVAVEAPREAPQGHYIRDLVGLKVLDPEGASLGFVKAVYTTAANDVYEIQPGVGQAYLIPAIKQVVTEINPAGGFMRVRLLPGLGSEGDEA